MDADRDMEFDGVSWEIKMAAVSQWWMDMEYIAAWWNQLLIMLLWFYMRRESLTRRYVLDRYFGREHMFRMVYSSDASCKYHLRLNRAAFTKLCKMLKDIGRLRDTIHMLIDEQVTMFLHILAHHVKNRIMRGRFNRSAEVISRHFHRVLVALLRLQGHLLKKPKPISPESMNSRWKCFENCLGALDGTYVEMRVPLSERAKYRNRKGVIATNVLAVCAPDMQFIYVLPGWEVSAADGRVLREAISRTRGLKVPQGYYYLVDAGYTNSNDFLAPYRGQRYHLNDWRQGHQPSNPREYFNMKHSAARNVIERCFGLLKQRWAILHSPSFYPVKTQSRIILCCCLLHNFCLQEMTDPFVDLVEANVNPIGDPIISIQPTYQWTAWRDALAENMYNEWLAGA